MKKRIITLLLSAAMVVSLLAGCGSASESNASTAVSEDAATTAASVSGDEKSNSSEATSASSSEESTPTLTSVVAVDQDSAGNLETTSTKSGGTLNIGTAQSPAVIGYVPELTGNSMMHFTRCAYESLTYYDNDGNIIGQLAKDWKEDPDEPSITFTLLEGVKFSDGTDFNADAVKWNLELYKEKGRSETNNIDSIEVIDDYTIKINLVEWQSSALEQIGFFIFYMSPTAVEKNGEDWVRQNSCGTGPYVVSGFEQGVSVSYVKNENYHIAGEPYLDGIEFKIFSDSTTLENAFKAGEVDVITYGQDCDLLNDLISFNGISFDGCSNGLGAESVGLIPSSADESDPFYKKEVRQALCYAVDWDSIVSSLSYGLYQRTNQWAVPGSETYNDEVVGYSYDPEKAKELLTEAGYSDGFETTLYTMSSGFYNNAAQAISAQLAEVGITANIEIVDATKGNDLMTNGWTGLYWHFASIGPDLGLYMGRHLDTNGAYYAKGIQHPDDALKLLGEIRTATDHDIKVEKELEMQKLIYDEYALFGMPLNVSSAKHIRYNYVKGGEFAAADAISWSPATCWLDK